MTDLDTLRSSMTAEQHRIIDSVWNYFRQHSQWPPVRLIHQQSGGKEKVQAALKNLGGSIIFEYEDAGVKSYRLAFLGFLLTQSGIAFERLLVQFLTYVVDKCAAEPFRTHVSSQDLVRDLGLSPDEVSVTGYLIREGPFSGSGSFSAQEWNVEVPGDVEDLPHDLAAHVRKRAFETYDPAEPIGINERSSYLSQRRIKASPAFLSQVITLDEPTVAYVDHTRIGELRAVKSDQFDLARLVELCNELNICYSNECYLAVAVLTRALIDHVPPLFGAKTFSEVVASNARSRSFRELMEHLDSSCRKIADAHLHVQIRSKEVLPNKTQVNFANDLDVLLAEIVRVLS